MTADEIIARLALQPHPEGGHYRQTWIAENEGRPCGTCIYFLLRAGERSHWHRVDATEIWLWHAGAPLILSLSAIVSKALIPGTIFPIGVVTALIGIPFFLSLILSRKRASW